MGWGGTGMYGIKDSTQGFGLSSLGTVEPFAELGQAAGGELVDQQQGMAALASLSSGEKTCFICRSHF